MEQSFAKLPIEIREAMLKNQESQGNPMDPTPFLRNISASSYTGGFNWTDTPEESVAISFWEQVLLGGDIELFYKHYPKVGSDRKLIGYKIKDPVFIPPFKAIMKGSDWFFEKILFEPGSFAETLMEQYGVIALWFDKVYENIKPTEKEIKVRSLSGDFTVIVSKKGIYYPEDHSWINLEDLKTISESKPRIIRATANHDDPTLSRQYAICADSLKIGCKEAIPMADIITIVAEYQTIAAS